MLTVVWFVIGCIVAAVLMERRPGLIALAIAIGAIVGLIPKDNLLAPALLLVIFLLRVNLGFGIVSAALFTWVGIALEPFADRLGTFVLQSRLVEPLGAKFFELPLIAWTSLNNTIVMGEFLIGLVLFYPIYRVSRLAAGLLTSSQNQSTDSTKEKTVNV